VLASAESLTGGLLGARVTSVPGASAAYVGGVVSYATLVKQSLLGIGDEIVAGPGVVSAECAAAMAQGVRALLGADVAVSTTGVAGPDPQEGKPVGLVYVGCADPGGVVAVRHQLGGDREAVRLAAVDAALALVRDRLAGS
jgi:nicotinamide-nucleotide amidase